MRSIIILLALTACGDAETKENVDNLTSENSELQDTVTDLLVIVSDLQDKIDELQVLVDGNTVGIASSVENTTSLETDLDMATAAIVVNAEAITQNSADVSQLQSE